MHELPVTEALLKLALEHADKAGARLITDIHIEVGELSSYVDDSVQFFWDIISQGTKAEGATLHFKRVPLQMLCSDCEHLFRPGGKTFTCPECGSEKVIVVKGQGLNLVALDIEKEKHPKEEISQ
jgi:hydrogenase nickel incorporation protein HypA/HybF